MIQYVYFFIFCTLITDLSLFMLYDFFNRSFLTTYMSLVS